MQKITPSEALVETLRMHDVKYVFGIVGSAYMDALDIFEGAGIQFIEAHEQGMLTWFIMLELAINTNQWMYAQMDLVLQILLE